MTAIKLIEKKKYTIDDRYKKFLTKRGITKDNGSNPQNLFDDLNKNDKVWLNIARNHLIGKT